MAGDALSTFGATPTRLAIVVGFFMLAGSYLDPTRSSFSNSPLAYVVQLTGLITIVVAMTADVWLYLRASTRSQVYISQRDFGAEEAEIQGLKAELSELRAFVEDAATERGRVILTPEDIEEVKRRTVEGLEAGTLEKISAALRADVEAKVPESEQNVSAVHQAIMASQRRLEAEVDALGGRANVNLTIGFGVSLVGMLALIYFIYTANSEIDRNLDLLHVGVRFVVKLSFVIFLQVFAYFFLRLYRHSLFEIKYFQNELTNIESKYLALNVALTSNNAEAVKTISVELAKTERNFILKKGESTVALQREEIEARYEAMVATKAEALIDRVGSAIQGKTK